MIFLLTGREPKLPPVLQGLFKIVSAGTYAIAEPELFKGVEKIKPEAADTHNI